MFKLPILLDGMSIFPLGDLLTISREVTIIGFCFFWMVLLFLYQIAERPIGMQFLSAIFKEWKFIMGLHQLFMVKIPWAELLI